MIGYWVVGYLVMDAVYVALSRAYYLDKVSLVAGAPPGDLAKVAFCAAGAYALMALGWACIVVPAIPPRATPLQAAKTGALYGLVLYGVFNFTTGAMFDNWKSDVMLRDTAWGTASIAAFTAAYAAFGRK